MELTVFEERAPLTEEQWERLIQYVRLTRGEQAALSVVAAKQFSEGMETIQGSTGHSQEEFGEVAQAVLNMGRQTHEMD